MKSQIVIGLFGLAISVVACGGAGTSSDVGSSSSADRLVLDVRCASNTDCPSGFECEVEVEHGVSTSYCKSHDTIPAGTTPACPAGYEVEIEHGSNFCKPHGGGGGGGGGGTGGEGGVDDHGGGGGGGADDDGGTATGTSPGTSPGTSTCTTSADCPAGLECEVQVEHGVTTSTCKAHGGGKK
jgi:hypothetical protein